MIFFSERSSFFEEMTAESKPDKDGILCVAIDGNVTGDEVMQRPFNNLFVFFLFIILEYSPSSCTVCEFHIHIAFWDLISLSPKGHVAQGNFYRQLGGNQLQCMLQEYFGST